MNILDHLKTKRRKILAYIMVLGWWRGTRSFPGDSYINWMGIGDWADRKYWYYTKREVSQ